jgi:hypothetical protein
MQASTTKHDPLELTNKAVQFSTLALARAFCPVAPVKSVWAVWPWNCTNRKGTVMFKSSGKHKQQLLSSPVEGKS